MFDAFLQGPVAARLHDAAGHDALTEHLRGLSLTGMGQDALEEVLAAEVPEARDWAAGEALAEAVLEAQHDVVLPWNTERDKRNPFASCRVRISVFNAMASLIDWPWGKSKFV